MFLENRLIRLCSMEMSCSLYWMKCFWDTTVRYSLMDRRGRERRKRAPHILCLTAADESASRRYTMEGDLVPSALGTFSPEAGIIPRTLHRLFHMLEGSEFTLRVSFMELYNEELRDLNAPDVANLDDLPTLRIFDDASRKGGVVVQGQEETHILSADQGIKILTRGSQRRQSASTKCNDQSSRSHSIFTITIHLKEVSNKGEDLLKVGKLNLVDLAGSENVGRSGAVSGRAREAGMINQSLLTLGRVINALVEKSSHVPYRCMTASAAAYEVSAWLILRVVVCFQRIQAHATASRLSRWADENMYHRHDISSAYKSRRDAIYARLCRTRQVYSKQA